MFNLIGKASADISGRDLDFGFDLIPKSTDLLNVIAWGINAALLLAGAIAVIYLVYGGILYITAGGDAEKATKGRTSLINAIVGIIIILLALVIVAFIKQQFNR